MEEVGDEPTGDEITAGDGQAWDDFRFLLGDFCPEEARSYQYVDLKPHQGSDGCAALIK